MICPICNTESATVFQKSGIGYNLCPNCKCCFTLDESTPETHNQGSEVRNEDPVNLERIRRIRHFTKGTKLLDFGCGNGQFLNLARKQGFKASGIDQNTELTIEDYSNQKFDVINCVEVIEHLISPREIVDHFHRVLKPGGIVYLESSFTDHLGNLANSGYVNPEIGHVLVHSRKSLEMLFDKFQPICLNSNVVVFKK